MSAIDQPSSIQSTGPLPRILTGAFVQLARHVFSAPEHIENDLMKGYLWNDNPKLSKILIESAYKWKPEDIQQRPAVMVKRNPLQFIKLGIGNRVHNRVAETGFEEDQYIVGAEGSHAMVCLGTTGTEAESVAEEIWKTFLSFSEVIRQQLCLAAFMVSEIGPVSILEEWKQHFAVQVMLAYKIQYQWSVTRRTPEWARVSVELIN